MILTMLFTKEMKVQVMLNFAEFEYLIKVRIYIVPKNFKNIPTSK